MSLPLISVGLPIRNGESHLDETILQIRNQTYSNLEIIISDNNSTDSTYQIAAKHAHEDARIRIYRHKNPISAVENFKFVFTSSTGSLFMWAAHDDSRTTNYIETLYSALQQSPDSSLAFSDLSVINDHSSYSRSLTPHQFVDHSSRTVFDIIKFNSRINPYHIYGLIRKECLLTYKWYDIDYGPDQPLIIHLALQGSFSYAPGAIFFYYQPIHPSSAETRAKENNFKNLGWFPEVRLSFVCAKAVSDTIHSNNRSILTLYYTAIFLVFRLWGYIKPALFGFVPSMLLRLYRSLKSKM